MVSIQCGVCGQPFEVTETVLGCPRCPKLVEELDEKKKKIIRNYLSKSRGDE